MKTLIIVRHAKSSWAHPGEADFDRKLNKRGKEDAPEMAKRVQDRGIVVDRFITSPAKRARKTCKAFCKVFGFPKDDMVLAEKLYQAPATVFYDLVETLDDNDNTVAVFAHNPGISDFANELAPEHGITELPTCGVFAVSVDIYSWKDFRQAEKKFLFFDYPRLEE